MGASLITHFCDTDDLNSVRRELKDLQEHDRDEKGKGGYSGGWHELDGLKVHDVLFEDRETVEDWFEAFDFKWRCHAVSFLDNGKKRWMIGGWSPT